MRVVLLYPPPFALPPFGGAAPPRDALPPPGWPAGAVPKGDEISTPYGLLSIAAQLEDAGISTTVINLYTFSWAQAVSLIEALKADLFGLSCLTANRRGVSAVARLIRRSHPGACIAVGGPHAGPLAREVLSRWPWVDVVVVGEGERTVLEMASRLALGRPLDGLAGAVCRNGRAIRVGPARKRIEDLDALTPPPVRFPINVFLSARGCPNRCTFCSSPSLWPGRVRFVSAAAVVDVLEHMVGPSGHRLVAVKDDTFCGDRKRVLEICRGIERRGLRFVWTCDTRADSLDGEVLRAMRRAGCRRISLGVESAAPEVLSAVRKRQSPRTVLRATALAKRFGFEIRYYMMAGNPGETAESLERSIAFLYRARPTSFAFSVLSLYPGTEVFARAEREGLADREMFFASDLPVFKAFLHKEGGPRLLAAVEWVLAHSRVADFWRYPASRRRKILQRLPDLPSAHLDLGRALLAEGAARAAEVHFQRALKMGYPLAGGVWNDLACIAAAEGDTARAADRLHRAFDAWPHPLVAENMERLASWQPPQPVPVLRPVAQEDLERIVSLQQPGEPGPVRLEGRQPGDRRREPHPQPHSGR